VQDKKEEERQMPEAKDHSTASNAKKPSRLGRGLGSLLGGADSPVSPMMNDDVREAAKETRASSSAPAGATASQGSPAHAAATAAPVQAAPVAEPARPQISEEQQIWTIPVDRLTPNTQQPRQIFTHEALRDLASSIKEKGILQPIVARRLSERQFEIIAGERRWRAAQAAGLHEVPVILKKVTEQESLELAIIENLQRENLNPMEEAEAFENLLQEYNLTQQEVADKLGKERSTVANVLRLLTLPPEVKALVRSNDLSAGHAKVLLGVEGLNQQIDVAKQVVAEKLSVRATEKLVAKAKAAKRQAASGTPAINLNVSQRLVDGLSTELQKLLGTKVTIDYADSKGKLSIHFYSDDQLTQVVEKLREAWEK
jgi:ParB family transcriptional regulator, chromosome partitioning protein